jgi:hypothetical protein
LDMAQQLHAQAVATTSLDQVGVGAGGCENGG